MNEILFRLWMLLQILVPFLFFMATVYLALHVVVAGLARRPDGPVLWFFAVVTGPLTRPVRLLRPGIPETYVRLIALGLYAGLWLLSGALVRSLGPAGPGPG